MTPIATAAAAPEVAALPIGAAGRSFEDLLGTDGQRHSFASFADRDILVLVFASNRCPTVKAYADRMKRLQAEYGPRGVQIVAINSNSPHLYPDESYPLMVERAELDGYSFPYLADPDQQVGMAYGATVTFHLFVLDADRRLRYSGRFDDARLEGNVTSHDLRNALDDLLDGRDVRTPSTRPFGCSLDFV